MELATKWRLTLHFYIWISWQSHWMVIHHITKWLWVMEDFFNLYDLWWVHKMNASVHFLCKIYGLFLINPFCTVVLNAVSIIVFFSDQVWTSSLISCWNLTGSIEIFKTSNLIRFLYLTQISWRLASKLQNHQQISVGHCVSLSISQRMPIWGRRITGLRWS